MVIFIIPLHSLKGDKFNDDESSPGDKFKINIDSKEKKNFFKKNFK